MADGRIVGDAVQPGEKLRVALEAGERLVGIDERFLDDILGIFDVAQQAVYRIEESLLVAAHQLGEGQGVPLVQASRDQPLIVIAQSSNPWTLSIEPKFPKARRRFAARRARPMVNDDTGGGACQKEGPGNDNRLARVLRSLRGQSANDCGEG